jgi:hypothetical protein
VDERSRILYHYIIHPTAAGVILNNGPVSNSYEIYLILEAIFRKREAVTTDRIFAGNHMIQLLTGLARIMHDVSLLVLKLANLLSLLKMPAHMHRLRQIFVFTRLDCCSILFVLPY